MGLKSIFRRRVEKQIRPQVEKELGNKSLAYMSRFVRGTISIAGVDEVRKQVIGGIEGDLKRALHKNPSASIEELIQDALNTPDYMALLKELDMGVEHLRLLAWEAQTKGGDK